MFLFKIIFSFLFMENTDGLVLKSTQHTTPSAFKLGIKSGIVHCFFQSGSCTPVQVSIPFIVIKFPETDSCSIVQNVQ